MLLDFPPTKPAPEQTVQIDWTADDVECAGLFQEINSARDSLVSVIRSNVPKLLPRFKLDGVDQIVLSVTDTLAEAGLPEDDSAITEAIDDALEREAENFEPGEF